MVDLLFLNGRIRTFVQGGPDVTALAVSRGRIVATGDVARVRDAVAADAETVDLAGGLLMPGLRDSHIHPLQGGLDQLSCDLTAVASDAGTYLKVIAAHARANPDLVWLSGGGWAMSAFPGGVPTASMLDAVTGDRPCQLVNRDRHGVWVNSAALRLAGITAATPDPADGRIERSADGTPTGMLHEGAARLVVELMPVPDLDLCVRALLRAQRHLHGLGLTGWHDAIIGDYLGYPDPYDAYRQIDAAGKLTASVTGALWWDRRRGLEQVPGLVARRAESLQGRRFRTTAVKIMVDGILENGTAALMTPYLGGHFCGSGTRFVGDDLREAVTALDAEGFQVHMHAIGDQAVRDALDAVAALADPPRHRHQIAHLQVVDPADVPRFGELGAVANVQMLWACLEPQMVDLAMPVLGPDRSGTQYPFASMLRGGAVLGAGSDWPVSTADPFAQIAVGVNRTVPGSPEATVFLPEERLALDDALAAFTVGAAWADHRDDDRGALRVGARADLSVFDRDPYAIEPGELASVKAVRTYVDGRCVFAGG
jgi:predicted amidohydrolase YtcJ